MKLSFSSAPENESDREAVYGWLREFNFQENGAFMKLLTEKGETPFFLAARDADGEVVGGISGSILFAWLRIDIMAVAPEHRGKGVGRELMTEAERLGREANCRIAGVDTMSYQAPAFDEKLGYRETGRLPDWDSHGHDKIFLIREL